MNNNRELAACIDIGTNSVLLLVASAGSANGWLKEIRSDQVITQLGKGLENTNLLKHENIEKTRDAIRKMVDESGKMGIGKIIPVGTQALRVARNADVFIQKVKEDTGLDIEVLSGEEESRLSFLAAYYSLPDLSKKIVADIGGGSTDIAKGAGDRISRLKSMAAGCMTLTEKFSNGQKILPWIKYYFEKELTDWKDESYSLVGLGGTVTTLAAVNLNLAQYDTEQIHGHSLTLEWIYDFRNRFAGMSEQEKSKLACIPKPRLGVLNAGIQIIIGLMEVLQKKKVYISDAGLRHAVLWEYIMGKTRKRQT